MSVAWAINGTALDAAGIMDASVTFRSGAPSELRLQRTSAYDATALLAYGTDATLTRGGTAFFRGKVRTVPRSASDSSEGQELLITDAWQDLEDTIYQEPWAVGSGSVDLPIAILGVDSGTGARITTAQQITEAVAYAVAAGVDIQMGSVPTGIPLWPTEVRNVSVAEVIRLSLRFHPDWSVWLDHSTGPPTLNVSARSAMTARSLSVTDCAALNIVRRDDLKPDAVRIVYLNATIIDGVTYRDGIIDKYPGGGPDAGPRVLSNVIELAGGQMQFQKSRIQTRPLPDDQASAKEWVKKKFPHLKDVDDTHFAVNGWDTELVDDPDDHPDPINPRAERLEVTDVEDLPRELVRGTIEDWMRKKVGRVRITVSIRPAAGATAAEKVAIAKGTPPVTVTATNAVTKIYKGVTQWTAPEEAPSGIAQRIYEALSAYQQEGSVTVEAEDVAATRYHGCRLNLTDGLGEWATMDAVIHQAQHDLFRGRTRLSIGPAPFLSADDFLELQRLFRGRPPTWMSDSERTSNELGAENDPGSKGDSVSGFDAPDTFVDPGGTAIYPPFYPKEIVDDGGTWKATLQPGYLEYQNIGASALSKGVLGYIAPKIDTVSIEEEPQLSLPGLTSFVYLKVPTNEKGVPTEADVVVEAFAEEQTSTHHRPPNGPLSTAREGEYYFLLFETESDGASSPKPVIKRALTGNKQLPNQLIEIEQIGGEVELFKGYVEADDRHQIRTLKALEGGSGGVSVLQVLEEPEDTVNFKWVGPGGSPIQINVEAEGDEGITVKGNGASGLFTFLDCDNVPVVSFEVADGLISSPVAGEAILGACDGGGGDPETTDV
jgi:hypothetical protein